MWTLAIAAVLLAIAAVTVVVTRCAQTRRAALADPAFWGDEE